MTVHCTSQVMWPAGERPGPPWAPADAEKKDGVNRSTENAFRAATQREVTLLWGADAAFYPELW